jgi:hypothetical protein
MNYELRIINYEYGRAGGREHVWGRDAQIGRLYKYKYLCRRRIISMREKINFHAGENLSPYGRKFISMREKIYFRTGENLSPCGRKFTARRTLQN